MGEQYSNIGLTYVVKACTRSLGWREVKLLWISLDLHDALCTMLLILLEKVSLLSNNIPRSLTQVISCSLIMPKKYDGRLVILVVLRCMCITEHLGIEMGN
jgi:hypothetical protein